MIHTHSCGEPVLDKDGSIIIECGGSLGMDTDEFAQCSKCVQKDIDADAKDVSYMKEKIPIKFYELNLILHKYCSAIQKEDDKSITVNFIKGDIWDAKCTLDVTEDKNEL